MKNQKKFQEFIEWLNKLNFNQLNEAIQGNPGDDYYGIDGIEYTKHILVRMSELATSFNQWEIIDSNAIFMDNMDDAFIKMFETAKTFHELTRVYRKSVNNLNRGQIKILVLEKMSEFNFTFTGWHSIYTDCLQQQLNEVGEIALNKMDKLASTHTEQEVVSHIHSLLKYGF